MATENEPDKVALTARIEAELQAEIDIIAAEDSKPGAPVTRSQAVRVLLWESVARRKAARKKAAERAA